MLLIAGQALRIDPLLKLGRGGYSRALAYISKNSSSVITYVGSDQDFRNGMLVEFYAPLAAKDKIIQYVERSKWSQTRPDWMLTHSQNLSLQAPQDIVASEIGFYRLVEEYRFAGVSGWNWFLYRRQE